MGDLAMDSELSTRISGIVNQLAEQEHQRLRAAGTFVELEELACEIGDEVTRQLLGGHLVERSNEVADSCSQCCPDCGEACSRPDTHHRELDTARGPIEYHEPAYYCHFCRRSFFPGGRFNGLASQSHRVTQNDSANGLGRK